MASADKPAKKPMNAQRLKAVAPVVWELLRPRRALLALGFVLMVINRVSGLVLPYSTRYLIDGVITKHHTESFEADRVHGAGRDRWCRASLRFR